MPEDKPARRKRPTIADVAKRAGVAPAIVSRALSPERRPVSREKRERVLKAAAELGYNQNPLARGLAKCLFLFLRNFLLRFLRSFNHLLGFYGFGFCFGFCFGFRCNRLRTGNFLQHFGKFFQVSFP